MCVKEKSPSHFVVSVAMGVVNSPLPIVCKATSKNLKSYCVCIICTYTYKKRDMETLSMDTL